MTSDPLRDAVERVAELAERFERGEIIGRTPYTNSTIEALRLILSALTARDAENVRLTGALEKIKGLSGGWDSPVMDAWDAARAELLSPEYGGGSYPRDIMESGLSIIWEAADDAIRARAALHENTDD